MDARPAVISIVENNMPTIVLDSSIVVYFKILLMPLIQKIWFQSMHEKNREDITPLAAVGMYGYMHDRLRESFPCTERLDRIFSFRIPPRFSH